MTLIAGKTDFHVASFLNSGPAVDIYGPTQVPISILPHPFRGTTLPMTAEAPENATVENPRKSKAKLAKWLIDLGWGFPSHGTLSIERAPSGRLAQRESVRFTRERS